MNYLYQYDDCIAAFSDNAETKEHKHWLLQLFITSPGVTLWVKNTVIQKQGIIIETNTMHAIKNNGFPCYTALIDPTSNFAHQLRTKYIDPTLGYGVLPAIPFTFIPSKNAYYTVKKTLALPNIKRLADERIIKAKNIIDISEPQSKTVHDVAKEVALSESRLSHLFKSTYCIPLQGYLLMHKWKIALTQMVQTGDITKAAFSAGFDSSAHFSRVNTQLTGMSGKFFSKNSRFM